MAMAYGSDARMNPMPTPSVAVESVLARVEGIRTALEQCHAVVDAINERLVGPQPPGEAPMASLKTQGIHHVALDVRSMAQTLQTRLEQIVGLLA